MAENPVIASALRYAAAKAAGIEPHPDDMPNLAQTVDPSYTQYMQRLPVFRQTGTNYSPSGMREGYEQRRLPPVIHQRNPFTTTAYRTFTDPWGQLSVQPLVGFPSAYPHVVHGVPTNFQDRALYALNLFGPIAQYQPPAQAPAQPQTRAAPRATSRATAPAQKASASTRTTPVKDYPPEWEWYHNNGEIIRTPPTQATPPPRAIGPGEFMYQLGANPIDTLRGLFGTQAAPPSPPASAPETIDPIRRQQRVQELTRQNTSVPMPQAPVTPDSYMRSRGAMFTQPAPDMGEYMRQRGNMFRLPVTPIPVFPGAR